MSESSQFTATGLLLLDSNTRVFLPSTNINIFPCSRRCQLITEVAADGTAVNLNCDPEARLNTERTNRLRTAINGFTDSFIVSFKEKEEPGTGTLVFSLAGYRIEIKEFNPKNVADALGIKSKGSSIYAHLSLHDDISLGVPGYYTEILYRQSTEAESNYIDVKYTDTENPQSNYFFMGVSFTKEPVTDTIVIKTSNGTSTTKPLVSANLPLFYKPTDSSAWELVQTSLLPKIEHGETEDSIKIKGDFTVEHDEQTSFTVTADKTTFGPVEVSKLTVLDSAGDKGQITLENGVIDAPVIEAATAAADTLNVNTITSDSDEIVVNKTLKVNTINSTDSLQVTTSVTLKNALTVEGETKVANNATITGTLKVDEISTNTNTQITIGTPINVTGKATLANGLDVTTGDTTLQGLSANNTKLSSLAINGELETNSVLTINGNGTVTGDLKVNTKTTTPTLEVSKITSSSEDGIAVEKDLTISGLTKAKEIDATEIAARASVTAPVFTQTIDGVENPVPAITLAEQSNGNWQLQIQRVTKKPKQA